METPLSDAQAPHDLPDAPDPAVAAALALLQRRDARDLHGLRAAAAGLIAALDAAAAPADDGADAFARAGFDRPTLARLFAMTGPDVAQDLVERLAEDLASAREALAPGAPCPPAPILRAQAHVLIGLAGSVGATRIHDAAARLGRACKAASDTQAVGAARDEVLGAVDAGLAFLAAEGRALPGRLMSDG